MHIFGKSIGCPGYVNTLRIKWCTEFKLLGITFDQTLDLMDSNYKECFEKVKSELSSWKHRFLTVFGKITVIKTMCLPKFTHIATVIPSLSLKRIKEIEREFEIFINYKNPSVTDKTTRYMARKNNGLGMPRINTFWRAIRMSWLRRLSSSKSTWAILHSAETRPYTFIPATSNMDELIRAKNMTKNLVWKDIYDSLLT